jgi:outer membrane protein OmpA-like peptidoglycan-associated protein
LDDSRIGEEAGMLKSKSLPLINADERGWGKSKPLTTKDTKKHKGIAVIAGIARNRRDRKTPKPHH